MKTQILLRALAALVCCNAMGLLAQESAPDRTTALAEARAGKWERAEPVLDTLAVAEPVDVEVCALLTLRRLHQKRAKEAVTLAERAAEAAPDQAAMHSLLGRALGQRIGELAFIQQGLVAPRMLRAFKRSVELDPNHVPGLMGLANYYLYSPAIAGGSYEKAEEYALQVEKRDPFNGAVLRARIRERQEQWAEAAVCCRQALLVQPGNAPLQVSLGNLLAKAGDVEAARLAYEQALKLQPELESARSGLAALSAPKN